MIDNALVVAKKLNIKLNKHPVDDIKQAAANILGRSDFSSNVGSCCSSHSAFVGEGEFFIICL